MEGGQDRRQVACRQGGQRGDRDASFAPFRMVAQFGEGGLEIGQQPCRHFFETPSFHAEFHMARGALEQPRAGLFLQRLDQRTEGGLRQVAGLRRAGEVAVRDQGHEGAQVFDGEVHWQAPGQVRSAFGRPRNAVASGFDFIWKTDRLIQIIRFLVDGDASRMAPSAAFPRAACPSSPGSHQAFIL